MTLTEKGSIIHTLYTYNIYVYIYIYNVCILAGDPADQVQSWLKSLTHVRDEQFPRLNYTPQNEQIT